MSDVNPQQPIDPPGTITNCTLSSPALLAGAPVYVPPGSPSGQTVIAANAGSGAVDKLMVASAVGLLTQPSPGGGAACRFLPRGPLQLLVGQWEAITGEPDGLTPGVYYYVSDATPGTLTKTAPTVAGHYVTAVGLSIDNETLVLNPQYPMLVP
jgi:hypothetical protein